MRAHPSCVPPRLFLNISCWCGACWAGPRAGRAAASWAAAGVVCWGRCWGRRALAVCRRAAGPASAGSTQHCQSRSGAVELKAGGTQQEACQTRECVEGGVGSMAGRVLVSAAPCICVLNSQPPNTSAPLLREQECVSWCFCCCLPLVPKGGMLHSRPFIIKLGHTEGSCWHSWLNWRLRRCLLTIPYHTCLSGVFRCSRATGSATRIFL